MAKKSTFSRKTFATKNELRRLRASVNEALEQIVMSNVISLKRTAEMIRDLERRVRRVKKASQSR